MVETNIPEYKLDEKFLKEFMFEMLEKPLAKEYTSRLPVYVQVIKVIEKLNGRNLYFLADGEFEMSNCVFMSRQARPELFSILKVKKISKPSTTVNNMNDNSLFRVGEIEFDTEVSGENIGFCLYKDLKDMDMKDLMKRKEKTGLLKVKETLETPHSTEIMKHMWENRSKKFCDINFTFEDEECLVFAHRSVLVAASEVFRAHSNNEGFIDNKSVHIVDSSLYAFNKLLEFIYIGKVQFTTWRLAFELLYLSKKYLLPNLENLCRLVIKEVCDNPENLLKVFEQNKKVNDEMIQQYVKNFVRFKIRMVINSMSFLNCGFSTIEWLFSLNNLRLDEWSRLCAIYKWACYNGANAFCQMMDDTEERQDCLHDDTEERQDCLHDDTEERQDCLHALLEYVHYENIDGLSWQRFFKLPKLPEIIDVSDLKQSVFDSLLEDGSYFDIGTNYPKYRSSVYKVSRIYAEIEIGSSEEREMKNIHLNNDGPVLGFKIKVEQNKLANGEQSLDIIPSFRYLYSRNERKDVKLNFNLRIIKTKSTISENEENVSRISSLYVNLSSTGEWQEITVVAVSIIILVVAVYSFEYFEQKLKWHNKGTLLAVEVTSSSLGRSRIVVVVVVLSVCCLDLKWQLKISLEFAVMACVRSGLH